MQPEDLSVWDVLIYVVFPFAGLVVLGILAAMVGVLVVIWKSRSRPR